MLDQAYAWVCSQQHKLSHTVIKLIHKILNNTKLKMHPDKTYLGCIKKDFDFLGVHFDAIPTIAKVSLEKHHAKLAQRYARNASAACIGDYVARWTSWCKSVLTYCEGTTQSNQPKGPSRYPQSHSCLGDDEEHPNGTKWPSEKYRESGQMVEFGCPAFSRTDGGSKDWVGSESNA